MNIFWLDYDLDVNASYYCDKHVVKMILEYAQLLSTACRLDGLNCGYRACYINHPCSIWVRESLDNWECLREMAYCLTEEFYYRFGKAHKSFFVIRDLKEPSYERKGITIPPQCMPSKYMGDDVVTAYRNYYIGEKVSIAKWTGRPVPSWFNFEGQMIE